MVRISYWILPIISGIMWLATLLTLLIWWCTTAHRAHYESMSPNQTIAYISDVGAQSLKPLFVAGCVITTVFLDLGFAADRWLRHRGRLVPNTTIGEKILSGLTIACALLGTAGLILLSVFDTLRHPKMHDGFLLLFIGGYCLSAVFICWEYQRLGIRNRQHSVLRTSFWIKLVFVVVTILLAIAFVACTFTDHKTVGAVFEWAIAFLFALYVFSFIVDLWPAQYTSNHSHGFARKGMPETAMVRDSKQGSQRQLSGGEANGLGGHGYRG